jgi:hypothetical protein
MVLSACLVSTVRETRSNCKETIDIRQPIACELVKFKVSLEEPVRY